MIKPGDILEVVIKGSTAFEGKGVARIDNFVIFVERTLPQETAKIKINKVKKSFAEAEIVEILKPSPHRIPAPCPYYDQCSGCQYQHIDYLFQIELKKINLLDILSKIGHITRTKADIETISSPKQLFYRNRMKYQIKKPQIGFFAKDRQKIIPLEKCYLAEEKINEVYKNILNEQKENIFKYDHLHIRCGSEQKTLHFFDKRKHAVNPEKNNYLLLKVNDKEFNIPYASFFQTNTFILPQMIEKIAEYLSPNTKEILIDAFCGVGFFSILLAKHYLTLFGIDLDEQAIEAARILSQKNNCLNTQFLANGANRELRKILKSYKTTPASLILDPPRNGVDKHTINTIMQNKIKKIVYISCYPSTLARDLNLLSSKYKLKKLALVDMFPQTSHMEVITLLELKK